MRRHVQRLVATLKQQPLLRVHCARLGRRDAKGTAVKALCPRHEAAMAHARGLHGGERLHLHRQCQRPTRGRHAAHGVATCMQQLRARHLSVAPTRPLAASTVDCQRRAHTTRRGRRT